jgi:hypothetical protein
MTTYDMANERISEDIANNKVDATSDNMNANNYAKNIMRTYEEDAGNPLYDNNPTPRASYSTLLYAPRSRTTSLATTDVSTTV